jgi:hypothetical protein
VSAPDRPALAPLTNPQRWLALATGLACTGLAVLGGIGSFDAVAAVAAEHGFAQPWRVPLEVDIGILALFNADLLFQWLRMSFVPLRWIAHALVGATIWFNMAASWGDPLGMAMHAVAPVLVVMWVEGVRHAIRARAQMAQRRHIESAQLGRWVLAPVSTFRLWRRQQLWRVAALDDALVLERRRLLAVARLRDEHGWRWRWKATALQRHALRHGRLEDLEDTPGPASPPGPGPTPTRRLPVKAKAKAGASKPSDLARAYIAELQAAGTVRRPDRFHVELHDRFGMDYTTAKRFLDREWPAAAVATSNGQGPHEGSVS